MSAQQKYDHINPYEREVLFPFVCPMVCRGMSDHSSFVSYCNSSVMSSEIVTSFYLKMSTHITPVEPVHIKMIILKLRHLKIIFMLFAKLQIVTGTKNVTAVLVLINTLASLPSHCLHCGHADCSQENRERALFPLVSMCSYMSNMFTCYMCFFSLTHENQIGITEEIFF